MGPILPYLQKILDASDRSSVGVLAAYYRCLCSDAICTDFAVYEVAPRDSAALLTEHPIGGGCISENMYKIKKLANVVARAISLGFHRISMVDLYAKFTMCYIAARIGISVREIPYSQKANTPVILGIRPRYCINDHYKTLVLKIRELWPIYFGCVERQFTPGKIVGGACMHACMYACMHDMT